MTDLERALAKVGDRHTPPAGWQGKVFDRVDRKPIRRWLWAWVTTLSIGFGAVGGLGLYIRGTGLDKERAEAEARLEKQRLEEALREQQEKMRETAADLERNRLETAALIDKLRRSQDAEEQKRLRDEIAARAEEAKRKAAHLEALRQADYRDRTKAVNTDKCKGSKDPLCGLK